MAQGPISGHDKSTRYVLMSQHSLVYSVKKLNKPLEFLYNKAISLYLVFINAPWLNPKALCFPPLAYSIRVNLLT